jgi:hypothetical protein
VEEQSGPCSVPRMLQGFASYQGAPLVLRAAYLKAQLLLEPECAGPPRLQLRCCKHRSQLLLRTLSRCVRKGRTPDPCPRVSSVEEASRITPPVRGKAADTVQEKQPGSRSRASNTLARKETRMGRHRPATNECQISH